MRTTLNIEDEALELIRKYAETRKVSLGKAASDLVHRGTESLPKFKTKNGWVIHDLPAGSPAITNEMLDRWEQEGFEEEYRNAMAPRR